MDDPALDRTTRVLVDEEVVKLRHHHLRGLCFAPPLEDRFERDTRKERCYRLWLEGLLAIGVLSGCLILDYLFVKDAALASLVKQIVVITPVALMVNALMRWNPTEWVREGSIAVGTTVICFINLYAEGGSTAATASFGLMSVLITVLFTNVVMRIRLPYMTASTIAMLIGGLWFAFHASGLIVSEKILGTSMMTLGVLVTLTAGYSLERQERLAYLLFLRSELQSAELYLLSNQDKLTGLPNRRAFEDRFESLWRDSAEKAHTLSVLLVDIDHFKSVNDLYGHMYGDEVLRRVGTLMPQALRVQEDMAARFGGEEFVILLPNTGKEAALLVAERVRKLVEMAGMPASEHLVGKPTVLATVSCGVSTYVPDGRLSRESLLKTADKALYAAKKNGRNRVEFCACEAGSDVAASGARSSTMRLLAKLGR